MKTANLDLASPNLQPIQIQTRMACTFFESCFAWRNRGSQRQRALPQAKTQSVFSPGLWRKPTWLPPYLWHKTMHNYSFEFNKQDVIFALKGVEQADFTNLIRTPDTDNKILTGTVNSSILLATLLTTPLNQRGF